MLIQRVVTAVVLLAVLLAALMVPTPWPLVTLLSLAAACALWEWLRLAWPGGRGAGPGPRVAGTAFFVIVMAQAWLWLADTPSGWPPQASLALGGWLLPAASALWVLGGTALVARGDAQKPAGGAGLCLFALVAVLGAWVALVQAYLAYGAWFLVSLMALIWFADIAAYFCGKAFGRRKLAPRVSPGKTWEGAACGVAAATLWVLLSGLWPDSFGSVLLQRWPWWAVALVAALLAALSIVGDLFESLLKRRAGVKDSSQLLPGHGGVYDRLDALLPVAPVALLLTGLSLA